MKSYGQYCAVARALDVVGDRWTLLIVRELLVRECRYGDLRAGLPGIATNLLAERLRAMEAAGLLEVITPGPPVATHLYRLTERGRRLEPVLNTLARWSVSSGFDPEPGDDAVRDHWLLRALRARFEHADLSALDGQVLSLVTEDHVLTLRIADGRLVEAQLGGRGSPDRTFHGSAVETMRALMSDPTADPRPDSEVLLAALSASEPAG